MRSLTVRCGDEGTCLGDQIGFANRPWSRLRGLLGKPSLTEGEGLLLHPCKAVHMWGMKFPIDVAFLDASGRVIATYENLEPGQRTPYHRPARYALELPAGTLARTGTADGDFLTWEAA